VAGQLLAGPRLGGNQGLLTDAVYAKSYVKSQDLSRKLLSDAGATLAIGVKRNSAAQIPVVVFNPLSWQRTDVVECEVTLPAGWGGWTLRDESGYPTTPQIFPARSDKPARLVFVAKDIPSTGYRTYYLEQGSAATTPSRQIVGNTMENRFLRVDLGNAGLKSVYDKQQKWEVLRTDKSRAAKCFSLRLPASPGKIPKSSPWRISTAPPIIL